MGTKIERKFLVVGGDWEAHVTSTSRIRQAYLASGKVQLRVRIIDGSDAVLTVKSSKNGSVRAEFEYPIPVEDALELLTLTSGIVIEKCRHLVPAGNGLKWEIDVFAGPHEGLVVAEIELDDPDQPFTRPGWIGREVTSDPRYFNSALARQPPE